MSSAFPVNSKVRRVPSPASMVLPVSENPKTVPLPEDNVNPLAVASPPLAPISSTPNTLNWKPATGSEKLYVTSAVRVGISGQSAASHSNEPSQHSVVPSPSHTPHSSRAPPSSKHANEVSQS